MRPQRRTFPSGAAGCIAGLVLLGAAAGTGVASAEVAPQAVVCFLSCDTLDPSRAGQETFPVPEKNINGRRLALHVSDVDGMAWGSIDNGTAGWWPSSWWNSAATLTALIDHGERRYDWVIARTFDQNQGTFPAGQRGTDPIEGNFVSRAVDDSAWWGLAWVAAYDHTGDQRYLTMATTIANYVHQYWDPSTCGGGVWWDRERTYKNAVTSGLYLRLAASVHRRTPGDTVWLQRTREAATWYLNSGLINAANLVNDGLTRDCRNNGQTVWTYNQGLAIGGLVEAWRATGDTTLLDAARRLADAAITGLTRDGILTESCDIGQSTCDDNQKQFKGIFSRYLADLAAATGTPAYRSFAQRQADSIWARDRDPRGRIGQRWAGGSPNQLDWRTQASGLGALNAT
jgi:predicted alpha-1,6-mannanase (GH76 family)